MFTHENNYTEQRILTKEEFTQRLLKAYEELNNRLKELKPQQINERNQNENLCNTPLEV